MNTPPVFFLDEAMGRRTFPDVLAAAGIQIERHKDHFEQGVPDTVWIPRVAAEGWYAITQDTRIRKNQVEREAVISSGLGCFYLTGANSEMLSIAHNFVVSHPAVLRFIDRTKRPFIASVQRGKDGKAGRVEMRWPKP